MRSNGGKVVPHDPSLIFANRQMLASGALVGPPKAVPFACRISVSRITNYSFKKRFATANWRYSCTAYVFHRLLPLTPTAFIVLSYVFATEICTSLRGALEVQLWSPTLQQPFMGTPNFSRFKDGNTHTTSSSAPPIGVCVSPKVCRARSKTPVIICCRLSTFTVVNAHVK